MKKFLIIICTLLLFNGIDVYAEEDKLIKNAVSGILIDADSGKILYEKNINEEVAVASMTKMMAQILILESIERGEIKWSDKVVVSKNAADMGGSQIYISEGEKISIEDLMKGISMASGNDATVQMAEVISGSEEKFVKLMNKKAKELGLKHTYFKNCTGLDEEGHYSSSYDMGVIARELVVKHPEILRFSSIYEDYLRENTKDKFWLVNTNKLVRFYEGADGLKTGHTDNAGYCLAATAKRNGLRLIGIVLGEKDATTRNNEMMELLDYGYSNYKVNMIKKKNDIVKSITLPKADKKIDVILNEDLGILEDVSVKNKEYEYSVKIDKIKLPVKNGDIIGSIKVNDGKKVIKEGALTVSGEVRSLSFFKLLRKEFVNLVSSIY